MSPSMIRLGLMALSVAVSSAAPTLDVSLPNQLFTRDNSGCPNISPGSGSQSNVDYYNGQPGGCPIKNKLDSDGSCKDALEMQGAESCTAYCEVKNSYFYGHEVRFTEFSSCRADEQCNFQTTNSLTITQTFSINAGVSFGKRDLDSGFTKRDDETGAIKAGFDLGASYSYAVATSTSTGLTLSRPSDTQDQCGYWTFVPIFWTSCGSFTTTSVGHNWYGGTLYCNDDYKTTGNYCNTFSYLDNQGNQAGETIFVLIDCTTQKLLPMDKQDPIYQKPGVSATG